MAGFISLNQFDATLRIPEFKGLLQYGDGIGEDPRYALETDGADTAGGMLQPMAAPTLQDASLANPIKTLAWLHRRWHTTPAEKDVLVAAASGHLYWARPGSAVWNLIDEPDGIGSYADDNWSWVTYEINEEGLDPVDVLLLSNASDGMICIRGDDMTASVVTTPKKFGVIARYAERIWGGAIPNDPDTLIYSAPFDPFDWNSNEEIPEDGAGDVQQPSWDGDSFTALQSLGSQLIAFKKYRAWRILGTDPGEYQFKEQMGGGAIYASTVAVEGERILMLSPEGLLQFDGYAVAPYYQEYAKAVFDRMNPDYLDNAFGCVWKNKYFVALPLDESSINNAVLVFDTVEKSWLLREDLSVETFLPMAERLFFTSATSPGKVYEWNDNAWDYGTAVPMTWTSPWFDLGHQNLTKGGYTIYLTAETQGAVSLSISVETEKKVKTKSYNVTSGRQKRLYIGGTGRRFRLIVESDSVVPWRLIGGIQVDIEIDPD